MLESKATLTSQATNEEIMNKAQKRYYKWLASQPVRSFEDRETITAENHPLKGRIMSDATDLIAVWEASRKTNEYLLELCNDLSEEVQKLELKVAELKERQKGTVYDNHKSFF
jgi:hypothetical protein